MMFRQSVTEMTRKKIPRLLTGVELGPVPLLLKYSLTFSHPKEMNNAMRRKRFGPK